MFFTAVVAGIKKGAKWFVEWVPASVQLGILLFFLLIGTHWYAMNLGYTKSEREHREAEYAAQELRDKASNYQAAEQLKVTARLRAIAAENKEEAERLALLLKEVPKYVTNKADARCTVTSGFERVYNSAATGSALGIPGSGTMDVDEETGIKISEIAAITVENFAECRERGKVIEAWQEWYNRSKDIFSRAQTIACGITPATQP